MKDVLFLFFYIEFHGFREKIKNPSEKFTDGLEG
jgi:hypothetical protein